MLTAAKRRRNVTPETWEQQNNWSAYELKYFDSELDETSLTSSTTTWASCEYPPATIGTLFLPVKGTGIINRIGRTVQLRWLKISGQITIPSQSEVDVYNPTQVRLLLVQNKQSSGAQTQAEDVIQSGTNIVPINMFSNLGTIGQYEILEDKRFVMEFESPTGASSPLSQIGYIYMFNFEHHFDPFSSSGKVNFKSDLGDYRDILDNSFVIIGLNTNSQYVPTISYKARFAFHDI